MKDENPKALGLASRLLLTNTKGGKTRKVIAWISRRGARKAGLSQAKEQPLSDIE